MVVQHKVRYHCDRIYEVSNFKFRNLTLPTLSFNPSRPLYGHSPSFDSTERFLPRLLTPWLIEPGAEAEVEAVGVLKQAESTGVASDAEIVADIKKQHL